MAHGLSEEQIKQKFEETDKDHGGQLDIKEIKILLKKLNIKEKDSVVKQKFAEVQSEGNDPTQMDLHEFKIFLEFLFQHPAVDEIFNKFKGKNTLMTAEDFLKFLKTQDPNVTIERAKEIIGAVERKKKDNMPATALTSSGFMKFFVDPRLNSLFNPNHEKKSTKT